MDIIYIIKYAVFYGSYKMILMDTDSPATHSAVLWWCWSGRTEHGLDRLSPEESQRYRRRATLTDVFSKEKRFAVMHTIRSKKMLHVYRAGSVTSHGHEFIDNRGKLAFKAWSVMARQPNSPPPGPLPPEYRSHIHQYFGRHPNIAHIPNVTTPL